jgi:hypothetical protein
MSKLNKLSYYSKLCDLFEANSPEDFEIKIKETVIFINNSLKKRKYADQYLENVRHKVQVLQDLKETIKKSRVRENGWGFCITNGRKNQMISLRPFYLFLTANRTIIGEMEELSAIMQTDFLDENNISEFKNASFTLRELIAAFDGVYTNSW